MLVSVAISIRSGAPWPALLGALGLALLYAYSFGPRLSYKGAGELLQVAGTGLVLPLYGFVAATGTPAAFPIGLWCSVLPLRLACAMATALPDEPSDRSSNKRTLVVILGGRKSSVLLFVLSLASLALLHGVANVPLVASIDAPVLVLAAVQLALAGKGPGTKGMLPRVAAQIGATLAFEIALGFWVNRT
jgi:1,4-dihydroxy-2-naphthoate octaprenyltransferase